MLIGYARTSKQEQNLDLQKDALQQAGCTKIFTDQVSGVVSVRPGMQEALEVLRKGDILVVWRLDRLGRSLKNLIELVETLEKKQVGFKSLQEAIDTTSTGGRLLFHIFGALSEFERNLIRERTMAGLAAARARGRNGGRRKALNREKRKLAVQLYREKKRPVQEICRLMGISKPTLYAYLKDESLE